MTTNRALVAHVLRRLGFGPSPSDLDTWATPHDVIDDLLSRAPIVPTVDAPNPWGFSSDTSYLATDLFATKLVQLMAYPVGNNPLQERIAWLLGNILVVSGVDGLDHACVADHVLLLRSSCYGLYSDLLLEVSKRPGMLRYLSGHVNTAEHPNQNYAREILELFSIGRVHPISGDPSYNQQDVVEIARALTGWRYDWITGGTFFNQALWDSGVKTFRGASMGAAKLNDVLDVILTHPAWPYYIPERLYTDIIGFAPANDVLEELAAAWGPKGDIKALITAIANRPELLSEEAMFSKVKQPVELIASAARLLGISSAALATMQLPFHLRFNLSQHPLMAPNVNGFARGDQWLGAGSLTSWSTVATMMLHVSTLSGSAGLPSRMHAQATSASATDYLLAAAGLDNASSATKAKINAYAMKGSWTLGRAAGALGLLLHSPEFLTN